jgi:hypothetical protein
MPFPAAVTRRGEVLNGGSQRYPPPARGMYSFLMSSMVFSSYPLALKAATRPL